MQTGIDLSIFFQAVSIILNFVFVLIVMWIRAELKVLHVKISSLEKHLSSLEKRLDEEIYSRLQSTSNRNT